MAATTDKEPRYIGVSIQDFLEHTSKEVQAGKYHDGTNMDPKVREALSHFTKTLGEAKLRVRHYVFVFDRFIFIKVSF